MPFTYPIIFVFAFFVVRGNNCCSTSGDTRSELVALFRSDESRFLSECAFLPFSHDGKLFPDVHEDRERRDSFMPPLFTGTATRDRTVNEEPPVIAHNSFPHTSPTIGRGQVTHTGILVQIPPLPPLLSHKGGHSSPPFHLQDFCQSPMYSHT
ncbi:hypothetical protein EDD16DRAFT_72760 [Pisolithus croceorrhizus]|nr:hypothetical protein EDD16DRAFT_72760 [Pisolithus croceorrhizus]